jgi:hypothetical protein
MTASQAPEVTPVTVSRRIPASADVIFAILASPGRHTEIDGSGMLRGAATAAGPGSGADLAAVTSVSGVGDVFVLNMYFTRLGDYQMANHVVEFEPGRRIAWEPRMVGIDEPPWGHRWGYTLAPDGPSATVVTHDYDCSRAPAAQREEMANGRIWLDAMTATLARLDQLAAGTPPAS